MRSVRRESSVRSVRREKAEEHNETSRTAVVAAHSTTIMNYVTVVHMR